MERTLTIIIPVYNEREAIDKILPEITKVSSGWLDSRTFSSLELILVDDGSSDGTRDILCKSGLPPYCKVVYHDENRGYGAAIKTGFAKSSNNFVAIVDFDLTYPLDKIPEL